MTIKNAGSQPITIDSTFVAGRTPSNAEANSGDDGTDHVLAAGEHLILTSHVPLTEPGTWRFWACYNLPGGRTCPNNWAPPTSPSARRLGRRGGGRGRVFGSCRSR